MSTVPATLVTMLVLSAAGLLPALALGGLRPVTVVLAPLAGSAVAGVAATFFMEWGWGFVSWFVVLAVTAAIVVVTVWLGRPSLRPRLPSRSASGDPSWLGLLWLVGILGALAACAWSLRSLATPTVGFDARAVWLLRGAWFVGSHRQLLIDFRSPNVPLVQTPYPPLVSASAGIASRLTGNDSLRLGVVVVAMLNTCALVAAVLAVLEAGRTVTRRLLGSQESAEQPRGAPVPGSLEPGERHALGLRPELGMLVPSAVAAVAAVALVFVAFGITEPFMTNGYADPIWSLAAVAAIAYGLQLPVVPSNQGAAVVLLLVAGLSKNEGVITASGIAVLIAIRVLCSHVRAGQRRHWWRPIAVAVAELLVIASWPVVMRQIHARGVAVTSSPVRDWASRARTTYDWMAPYLHVLVLAVAVSVLGGLILRGVRRAGGLANDGWAWAALAGGLFAISAAIVTGTGSVDIWLVGIVHRVTEFPVLAGWWIIAVWSVAASAAPALALARRDRGAADVSPPADHDETSESEGRSWLRVPIP